LEKQIMEGNTADPFDFEEALRRLQRAVDPLEIDINVIMKTLKLDEKAMQELRDYIDKTSDNTQCLPSLKTAFFLYNKLASPEMCHDENAMGMFFKLIVHLKTSATIAQSIGKFHSHSDVKWDDTSLLSSLRSGNL